MQGIRHAHPAMYAALAAFAIYLAVYSLSFVWLVRQCWRKYSGWLPFWIAVPVIGTGLECIRNYFLTGVSAVMLGHTQADNPAVIQIADAFGSYGVTFLVSIINAAIYQTMVRSDQVAWRRWVPAAVSFMLLASALGYGKWRLDQTERMAQDLAPVASIALIGRDEDIVFVQDSQRELEIFEAYFRQSVQAAERLAETGGSLDLIVWPESMFTGSLPWMLLDDPAQGRTSIDPQSIAVIEQNRKQFEHRSAQIQAAVRRVTGQSSDPHLVVGCSVVYFGEPVQVFSSAVHVGQGGRVADWYGKTHLVMFGEYIPWIDYLPWVHAWLPPGMGVQRGSGPVLMRVNGVQVSPNVCIETAVERVALNQVTSLAQAGHSPDAIVNVTNDGWFDHSSIVEHHLRCSQFVAVACRRPLLIAANGGPTAWIDGAGRVVQRLRNDEAGAVIAGLRTDARWGLYQVIGDWPPRIMAGLCVWLMLANAVAWLRRGKSSTAE